MFYAISFVTIVGGKIVFQSLKIIPFRKIFFLLPKIYSDVKYDITPCQRKFGRKICDDYFLIIVALAVQFGNVEIGKFFNE